jgi:hypothetical protein
MLPLLQHIVSWETEIIPIHEALQLHWKPCCWVYQYWSQSLLNQPKLPSLTDYGWEISSNSLRIVWDSDVHFKKVEKTVEWHTQQMKNQGKYPDLNVQDFCNWCIYNLGHNRSFFFLH